jgi:chorismate-pyruvate lyase
MTPFLRQIADLFHPLTDFYSPQGVQGLHVAPIKGDTMPRPYRDLLVHDQDMTSTLETYWGTSFHLKVLDKHVETTQLTRQVVLLSDEDDRPVEFGAIRICLDRFGDEARKTIISCQRPLGNILNEHGLSFTCRPNAYFTFESDEIASRAFLLTGAHTLYGRHNLLENDAGSVLAEVVEILPPFSAAKPHE